MLYDYLASAELLETTRPGAQLICLGRHGHGRLMSQEEINQAMIGHAREGRTVVRLKGGDPTIFARMAEELAALEAAGVPYEIVPGITAAQAASSHAGIPLTERDEASCVAFVTGQESARKAIGGAARLCGAGRVSRHARVLHGRHDGRPVEHRADGARQTARHAGRHRAPRLVARSADASSQRSASLADVVRTMKLRPPAVVIVGDVARQRNVANWFTSRPLFGRTVLVTRTDASRR